MLHEENQRWQIYLSICHYPWKRSRAAGISGTRQESCWLAANYLLHSSSRRESAPPSAGPTTTPTNVKADNQRVTSWTPSRVIGSVRRRYGRVPGLEGEPKRESYAGIMGRGGWEERADDRETPHEFSRDWGRW